MDKDVRSALMLIDTCLWTIDEHVTSDETAYILTLIAYCIERIVQIESEEDHSLGVQLFNQGTDTPEA